MIQNLFLLLACACGVAKCAPTFVQSVDGGNASPVSVSITATTGNTVKIILSWGGSATLTSCQDGVNTYALGPIKFDATATQSLALCYATNVTGGTLNITTTFSSGGIGGQIVAVEYSGVAATGAGDGSASNAASGTMTTDGETCGSITTAISGDFILADIIDDSTFAPSSDTFSAGTGYTRRYFYNTVSDQEATAGEDQVQSSAGSITPTWTATTTGRYACVAQAFKPTCGSGFGWPVSGGQCRGVLTATGTGKTWTVPSDWSATNTIELIGAGATGANGASSTAGGSGGGGGGGAKLANTASLTAGSTVGYQVGAAGITGGSTFLCSSGTGGTSPCSLSGTTNAAAVIALACGATQGTSGGGKSGACANSGNALGTSTPNPAAGGNAAAQASGAGGGGGGAAGKNGAGGAASGATGGTADNATVAAGISGSEWGTGVGSGGGGNGQASGSGSCTAAVGQYGGGGGGGAKGTSSTGCAGKQGLIAITYTPASSAQHNLLTLGIGE